MQEAVTRLKAELGSEAVIEGTQRGTDRGQRYVEIQARSSDPAPRSNPGRSYKRPSHPQGDPEREALLNPFAERAAFLAQSLAPSQSQPELTPSCQKSNAPSGAYVSEALFRETIAGLEQHLEALKSLILGQRSAPLQEALQRLGLSDAREIAEELGDRRPEDPATQQRLAQLLERELDCALDLERARCLAFVGPTGVGKTTTIAKVAARAKLLSGRSVALVTVDTFRMAAVEQLSRYAEILECPLKVARRPEELPQILESLKRFDLILVDSAGRSPQASEQLKVLGRFFPKGWGGELILTLAASTREQDLFSALEAFEELSYDLLCITKLDETSAPGTIHSLGRRAGRPLAWITDGQKVPEDIERAEPQRLALRIAQGLRQRYSLAQAS